jgi:hypothetical protein
MDLIKLFWFLIYTVRNVNSKNMNVIENTIEND